MGDTRIVWTPRDETGTVNLNITDLGGLVRFRSYPEHDAAQTVTVGGKAVTVCHAQNRLTRLRIEAIGKERTGSSVYLFGQLSSFASHAMSGGTFAFEMDADDVLDTTLNGAVSKGDTTITLTSTTGLEAGDWLYLEDADDPSKWEVRKVVNPATTSLEDALTYGFADGSVARHWEYFPTCVALPGSFSFHERDAGRGASLWDLELTFRQTR